LAICSRRRYGERFPLGTLLANLTGSFLIGLILGIVDERDVRLLLATGFLGAETTVSAFAVETVVLMNRGERSRAVANVIANGVGSLAAAASGLVMAWLIRELT
jgi:fluoride exporter